MNYMANIQPRVPRQFGNDCQTTIFLIFVTQGRKV